MHKAAIIGCGMIAGRFADFSTSETYSHAKAYYKNPAFGKIAFVDADSNRAIELASRTGGCAYTSITQMLSDFCPDVVSVCTPDNFHFANLESVIQGQYLPKVIFVEKPVCNSRTELSHLRQFELSGSTRIIVNHSRRFDSAHHRLKELFNSGGLGDLVRVHVDYYGGWRHLGVHVIDILQYLFGYMIELEHVEYVCESKYKDDPTLNIKGRIGDASFSMTGIDENFYQILDMSIFCQRGQVKITDFGKDIAVFRKSVNAEHENVLVRSQSESGVGMQDCICNAVNLISQYLDIGEDAVLQPYGLQEAQMTMDTIWNGSDMYGS